MSHNDQGDECPIDPAPENRVQKVSSLCSYGTRPHVMTGLLRQLLIQHFVDPNNIEEPKLRQKFLEVGGWKQNENGLNDGGILIESITRWLPNDEDKRPAVLIKRNDWAWQRVGIGDKAGSDYTVGSTNYLGLWEGSHTLYCLSLTGLETELLAIEVVKFLQHFGPWIREQMDLKRFMITQVGGVGEIKEVVQGYAVPVTVSYVAEESWSLQPYAPRLKRIVLKASELFMC
jgi:hypothetical protein